MSKLSNKDIDSLVQAEYEEALANGEPWAEEAYAARASSEPEPVLVTDTQARVLEYLDSHGDDLITIPTIVTALFRNKGRSPATNCLKSLIRQGLVIREDVPSMWHGGVYRRTDKPWARRPVSTRKVQRKLKVFTGWTFPGVAVRDALASKTNQISFTVAAPSQRAAAVALDCSIGFIRDYVHEGTGFQPDIDAAMRNPGVPAYRVMDHYGEDPLYAVEVNGEVVTFRVGEQS